MMKTESLKSKSGGSQLASKIESKDKKRENGSDYFW